MKKKFNLIGILLLCLLYRVYYFEVLHPNAILYNSDSVTYFTSIDIFKGIIDAYRTPLYIYVLRFFENLSKIVAECEKSIEYYHRQFFAACPIIFIVKLQF